MVLLCCVTTLMALPRACRSSGDRLTCRQEGDELETGVGALGWSQGWERWVGPRGGSTGLVTGMEVLGLGTGTAQGHGYRTAAKPPLALEFPTMPL